MYSNHEKSIFAYLLWKLMFSDDEVHEFEQRVFMQRLEAIDYNPHDPEIKKRIKALHINKNFTVLSAAKEVQNWSTDKQKQLKCALEEMAHADGNLVPEEIELLNVIFKFLLV